MAYRSLPLFSPEARFVANRAFLFNGQQFHPGDAVEGIPERRLRQMFESRWVAIMPPEGAAHAARKEKSK